MFSQADLSQIIDSAVKDISKRVAKTEVIRIPYIGNLPIQEPWTFFSKTEGDYDLTVAFCTDRQVVNAMVRNMKRGSEATEEEVSAYMQEFFNILCGHIISAVNQSGCLKAYFSIPTLIQGGYEHTSDLPIRFHSKYDYDSPYGAMRLEALQS